MRLLPGFVHLPPSSFIVHEIDAEMEEELRSHIQLRADDLERSGLARAEAERRARIEFGGRMSDIKEECHEAMGGNFIETLMQDVRFAFACCASLPDSPLPPF